MVAEDEIDEDGNLRAGMPNAHRQIYVWEYMNLYTYKYIYINKQEYAYMCISIHLNVYIGMNV